MDERLRIRRTVPFTKETKLTLLDEGKEFKVKIRTINGYEVVLPGELNEQVGSEMLGIKEDGSKVVLLPEMF